MQVIDKYRRNIIAGILACKPMPTREHVQAFRKAHPKKATIAQVCKAFKCKSTALRAFSREIKLLTNDALWARWPKAAELFAEIPRSDADFSSRAVKKVTPHVPKPPTRAELNALHRELNALRRQLKLKPLKTKQPLRETYQELIKKCTEQLYKSNVEQKFLARTVAPVVVAEGAYISDKRSVAATGHTGQGVNKAAIKRRRKLERYVNGKAPRAVVAAVAGESRPTDDDHISLAQVARELGIEPRVARAKARRNPTKLPKTTGGWTFAITDKAKVIKFLQGDSK